MAFVAAAPGWFRSKTVARQGQGRPPLQKPPLGKRDPPLRYQVGFTGTWAAVQGMEALPATERTARFPVDHP